MSATDDDPRQAKALTLHEQGVKPVEVGRDVWTVQGSSAEPYEIRRDDDFYSCSCLDFTIRGLECKHIRLVKLSLKTCAACDHSANRSAPEKSHFPHTHTCGAFSARVAHNTTEEVMREV